MKPPPFEYIRPDTQEEALALLDEYGPEARLLAGGQSLVPLLNFRLAYPTVLIDIHHLKAGKRIHKAEGQLTVGFSTTQEELLRYVVRDGTHAMLSQALPLIGHPATRSRGTVCGSVAHADPVAELAVVVTALDGRVNLRGRDADRSVPAEEFFVGPFTTLQQPHEMVESVTFPITSPRQRTAFMEVSHRHGDFATVAVALRGDFDSENNLVHLRAVGAGLRSQVVRLRRVEEAALAGDDIAEAAHQESIEYEDIHGSTNLRRRQLKALCVRSFEAIRTATSQL